MSLDDAARILSHADVPLWLLTSRAGERQGGLIASFVQNASLVDDLPRIVVGLAKHHQTTQLIEASGRFGLHSLAEQNLPLVWQFGMQSGKVTDKLAGCSTRADSGLPLLSDVPIAMECTVEAKLDVGDRILFLAAVTVAHRQNDEPALTRNRMVELATPEQLQEMRRQRLDDTEVDRAAILAWRKR